MEELGRKIHEHGWPRLRPVEALALRLANQRMADMERGLESVRSETNEAMSEMASFLAGITGKIDRFDAAVFHPETGIIVRQNQALDRARWTIIVMSVIAAVVTSVLGTLISFYSLFGKGGV